MKLLPEGTENPGQREPEIPGVCWQQPHDGTLSPAYPTLPTSPVPRPNTQTLKQDLQSPSHQDDH